jgi:hypothetical protein
MDLWKKAVKIVQTFAYVIAGITISASIFITLFVPGLRFTILLLWQIIIMSAVCALGNLIYYYKEVLSKRQMRIRIICHYIYINLVVLSGSFLWGWLTPGLIPEFLLMLLLIAIVYVIITFVSFRQEMKIAESINRELRKRYSSQEEDE